jgi:dTDP-4-dehydrorhamnose reductase
MDNPTAKRAWVTGAAGLIGGDLVKSTKAFAAIALTRQELDLTNFAATEKQFRADSPQLIIHCAAMSKSPDCQANPTLARKINVEATAHLASLAAEIPFIFFSSDLVFDGRKGNYTETDAVNPLSVYGETKVAAEQIVLTNPRHTVIRTSLNSGASPRGDSAYNEQMQLSWKRGETLKLFVDEYRCPIPAAVTARAVWELIEKNCTGLYHFAGSQRLSRLEIGTLLAARHPELNPRMKPCSLREYRGAPRPADASLDCSRIQRHLSFPLPGLSQYLQENPAEPF